MRKFVGLGGETWIGNRLDRYYEPSSYERYPLACEEKSKMKTKKILES